MVSAVLAFAAHAAERANLGAANCISNEIRITALVNVGDKVKVGIVEQATSNSYFVAAGEKAGAIEVVAIDYANELVTLRRGETSRARQRPLSEPMRGRCVGSAQYSKGAGT